MLVITLILQTEKAHNNPNLLLHEEKIDQIEKIIGLIFHAEKIDRVRTLVETYADLLDF